MTRSRSEPEFAHPRSWTYLSLRGVLLLLILGVLVPVVLVSAAGIVALTLLREAGGIVIAVLVVTGALASLGALVAVLVMLSRRFQLARQQVNFLTNVTHELRTPLAAIRLYAQTLELDNAQDASAREECIAAILRESRRLEHLVNRVLEWRSIVEGKRRYVFAEGPVGPALDEALDSFRAILRAGEVDLKTEIGATTVVKLDRAAMAEAVLNLLVNAHKYSGDDKRIFLGARDVEGGVEITVRDNGIGIPRPEQEKVFEPFHRVDSRLRAQGSGVGLGLAIVGDTVRAHRGRIALSSEPGLGSTFTIFLPAVPAAAQADGQR
jgi:two-component system phosphate regulon sensor histidine kinase PhoR